MRYLSISLLLIASLIVLAIGVPLVAQAINPVIDEQHSAMLRLLVPSWDQLLDSTNGEADGCNSDRFTCVLGGAAVRDNETGLVWDRSPAVALRTWDDAIVHCSIREVGGRMGWHVPMKEQLASLVDKSNRDPALPTDHPFLNIWNVGYWSATTDTDTPWHVWRVLFATGWVNANAKVFSELVWCVRGGQSFDGNTHSTLH